MKTKKVVMLLGMTMVFMLVAGGCTSNTSESINTNYESDPPKTDLTKTIDLEEKDDNSQTEADIPMVELPEDIQGIKAETTPNEELKNLMIEFMEIPDDYLESTRYYYNYVDLDDDSSSEIFVLVSGMYTSGSGGSSALIVSENAGRLHVTQNFTLVNTPVIISDEVINGHHTIIVPYYGNEKTQYSVLTFKDGEYVNVPDGEFIDSLDGISGKAIIANDLIQEATLGILGLNLLTE